MVQEIQATWKGPLDALQQYQVRGQVQGLTLAGPPRKRRTVRWACATPTRNLT